MLNHEQSRIYLSPPHMSGKEQAYLNEAFLSNMIAPVGPHIEAFEKEIAEYVGVGAAAAVNSGTAALHLALRVLGVGVGDCVFCSSFTFVATANPIVYEGAEPVFIDSEPDTWNMSPQALERALLEASLAHRLPKAVIVVHLYGQMAKLEDIIAICDYYGVPVIEDAAESLGSTYRGRQSGTFGYIGVYSFNGNKIITTSGGGMLVSDNQELVNKARFLSTQARDTAPYYQHSQLGFNYRLSNLLAGVGRAQLSVISERISARRAIFGCYEDMLMGLPGLSMMPALSDTRPNRWLSTVLVDKQAAGVSAGELIEEMNAQNIEVRHLWKPLHMQPLFMTAKMYAHDATDIPVCEQLFGNGLCLPSGSSLSVVEQLRIVSSLQTIVEGRHNVDRQVAAGQERYEAVHYAATRLLSKGHRLLRGGASSI